MCISQLFDGDHDEADCAKRGWSRTMVHNTFVDALCRFLKDCGMDNVMSEVKYWDSARIGSDGSRRVPDVTCTHPRTGVEYVIDARIFWNSMSEGPTGYTAYTILLHWLGRGAWRAAEARLVGGGHQAAARVVSVWR